LQSETPRPADHRLAAVRLFYDYLVEEGLRDSNPVGRGRFVPGSSTHRAGDCGLLPRFTKLPWIPSDAQWRQILIVVKADPLRNRLMLALAYDAGLRHEELCSVRTDDLDPAHRTIRVRAETTKTRRGRVMPYSATSGALLQRYLIYRSGLSPERGLLFLSESRRNRAPGGVALARPFNSPSHAATAPLPATSGSIPCCWQAWM
jgi:site-specific recombinase XerD